MLLAIGQTVGEYRVVDVIGAGGMGTVYKVQHLISDRIEAMKVILPELIDSPELADRFIREIKVQARLNHPNIASLHNALHVDNRFMMVMEYIEGSTLHARLRQGSISPAAAINIVLQVLSALAYAHAQGVIHRDIKPANIMFTGSGVAKLMDFGIARSLNDQHLTRAGAAVGSVYYMSPEQVQAAEVDARSDLYSVGIMLYEMVTGARPITGESSWAIMNAHLHHIPRPPVLINPELPHALSVAILTSIEKSPPRRFQTAIEFSDALESIVSPAPGAYSGAALNTAPAARPAAQLAHSQTPVLATPPPTEASSNRTPFDADGLDRVIRELAAYVGPMAKVLVGRAAKKATSWKRLYDLLAEEVPEGPERRRFLSKRPL